MMRVSPNLNTVVMSTGVEIMAGPGYDHASVYKDPSNSSGIYHLSCH